MENSSSLYQQWRLVKDSIARYGVIAGGMGVIIAVVMIFFYLLYVVFPLFLPASVEHKVSFNLPEKDAGKTVLLDMEEQNELAARFTDQGKIVFFKISTGEVISTESIKLPEGTRVTSFSQGSPTKDGIEVYGLSDGKAVLLKHKFDVTYNQNQRVISPSLSYPMGEEPIELDASGAKINAITAQIGATITTVVAEAGTAIKLVSFEKEESLFADEASVNKTESLIDIPAGGVNKLLLDKDGSYLYVVTNNGSLLFYDINDKSSPILKHTEKVVEDTHKITSVSFLNGDLSLLIGDSSGVVTQWTKVRDKDSNLVLKKIRSFTVSKKPVIEIKSEQRRKGFMTLDGEGNLGVFHSTSEKELIKEHVSQELVKSALSPRANGVLLQSADDKVVFWTIDNEHPEVSFKTLWQEVWYESYDKPDYIWQSSASNNDFEPKYSLIPLVFGTLKAAFYAMLVAMPLALMSAVYSAYFMAPAMRQYVKPTIEIMGALPTVILGFLAGLWLAPFVEENLAGIFCFMLLVPLSVLLFSLLWEFLPAEIVKKVPEGWDSALIIPVILLSGWIALSSSLTIEDWFFNGSLREWIKINLGLGYDQRNSMIVGIAMGFAVIPTIYTIAEDAVFSVPKHLTVGSLALGATAWQTMIKIVLLTASPGIFSAVMIGLGRAVGETMIVLMATGNTPVMDLSVFQGMRTLAANIAVEMPESEVDSTHYRILFLSALVLFAFTFIFNTFAEIIRQRLREKYSSL